MSSGLLRTLPCPLKWVTPLVGGGSMLVVVGPLSAGLMAAAAELPEQLCRRGKTVAVVVGGMLLVVDGMVAALLSCAGAVLGVVVEMVLGLSDGGQPEQMFVAW